MNANRHTTPSDGAIAPTLLDYLQVLRRRKLIFLLIVVLVPATAVALAKRQTPVYQASSQVVLGGQGAQAQPGVDPQTQATVARATGVLNTVIASVPRARLTETRLRESSAVSTTLGTSILTFSVKSSSPELAMQLATAYAVAYTNFKLRGHLKPPSYVFQRANEATKVAPRTVRNGAIAFFLGIMLALVVAFLADAFDTRIRSADTIREALDLLLLGRLPAPPARVSKRSGLVMLTDPASLDAEPFRVLRANFDFANAEHGSRTVMFTSAGDGEGKSTTAANLAITLARAGRRVVLIDADLRKPSLHAVFGLEERPGLTDVSLGDVELDDALRSIHVTDATFAVDGGKRATHRSGSLKVLPAGHALHDPDELGAERAVGTIIQRARESADLVLVDAAPLLVGDAIALSAHVDALVLITRLKALRKSTLADLNRILAASPAVKLGFILTGAAKSTRYSRYPAKAPSGSLSARLVRLTTPPASENGNTEAADPLRRETRASDT